MSDLSEQAVKPQDNSSKSRITHYYPSERKTCPQCGEWMNRRSKICRACRRSSRRQSPPFDERTYTDIHGVYRRLQLTQHKYSLVDSEDFETLASWSWFVVRKFVARKWKFYARRSDDCMGLHSFILKCPKGVDVDHIDGDGLNNRKHNLRICSESQNQMNRLNLTTNTSGFRGVVWDRRANKWKGTLTANKIRMHLGYFTDPIRAAKARDEAARKHHGNFAVLNFP